MGFSGRDASLPRILSAGYAVLAPSKPLGASQGSGVAGANRSGEALLWSPEDLVEPLERLLQGVQLGWTPVRIVDLPQEIFAKLPDLFFTVTLLREHVLHVAQ